MERQSRYPHPLAIKVGACAAVIAIAFSGAGCEKSKSDKSPSRKTIGKCIGEKAVKIRDNSSLEDVIKNNVELTDPLYNDWNKLHSIAGSLGKRGLKRPGSFTIKEYSWYEHAQTPKKGSVVHLPTYCMDTTNMPKSKKKK